MPTFPIPVDLTVAENNNPVNVTVSEGSVAVNLGVETPIVTSTIPDYEGEYVFTPTQETQTVGTNGMRLLDNITINPIPSNYGLIGWNGSILTVS
jgi:hypothetical protein